jgi:hypothetical protein
VNGSLKKMQSENWEQEPQKLISGRAKREKKKTKRIMFSVMTIPKEHHVTED